MLSSNFLENSHSTRFRIPKNLAYNEFTLINSTMTALGISDIIITFTHMAITRNCPLYLQNYNHSNTWKITDKFNIKTKLALKFSYRVDPGI